MVESRGSRFVCGCNVFDIMVDGFDYFFGSVGFISDCFVSKTRYVVLMKFIYKCPSLKSKVLLFYCYLY